MLIYLMYTASAPSVVSLVLVVVVPMVETVGATVNTVCNGNVCYACLYKQCMCTSLCEHVYCTSVFICIRERGCVRNE